MEPTALKTHIEETNQVPKILEALGCHHITERPTEYRAALPHKTNPTALTVHKQGLRVAVRAAEGEQYGDIFTLTMQLCGCTFPIATRRLHQLLGLPYTGKATKPTAPNPLDIFRRVTKRRQRVNQPMPLYDDGIIREYMPGLHISWVREGITPAAAQRFNIGYSLAANRIVIPERLWCGADTDYIGVMGRTTVPEYALLGIPKYYPLKPYPKGLNLYGLQENYAAIQAAGQCTVFESQKSVLKRYSRKDETAVALGGSTLTEQQARILIGLNVAITLAFDEGLSQAHIFGQCEKLAHCRPTYYIHDKWGLLGEKESPADRPDKEYRYLHKYRRKYGEDERKQLHVWLAKPKKN